MVKNMLFVTFRFIGPNEELQDQNRQVRYGSAGMITCQIVFFNMQVKTTVINRIQCFLTIRKIIYLKNIIFFLKFRQCLQ